MWGWLSYLYNSILIIFIAAHLLVGAIIAFGIGVYTGIYLSQNYEIPRIDEPSKLWDCSVNFLEKYRKKTPGNPPRNNKSIEGNANFEGSSSSTSDKKSL